VSSQPSVRLVAVRNCVAHGIRTTSLSHLRGSNSGVESQPSKLLVAGSNPVSRSEHLPSADESFGGRAASGPKAHRAPIPLPLRASSQYGRKLWGTRSVGPQSASSERSELFLWSHFLGSRCGLSKPHECAGTSHGGDKRHPTHGGTR